MNTSLCCNCKTSHGSKMVEQKKGKRKEERKKERKGKGNAPMFSTRRSMRTRDRLPCWSRRASSYRHRRPPWQLSPWKPPWRSTWMCLRVPPFRARAAPSLAWSRADGGTSCRRASRARRHGPSLTGQLRSGQPQTGHRRVRRGCHDRALQVLWHCEVNVSIKRSR